MRTPGNLGGQEGTVTPESLMAGMSKATLRRLRGFEAFRDGRPTGTAVHPMVILTVNPNI